MLLYVNPISASLRSSDPEAFTGAKRRVALEELEHFFAFTLLKEMRKTVPEGGVFRKTQAQEIQEEMLDDALSGAMAKTGQLGIAHLVDRQLRIAEKQATWRAEIDARRYGVTASEVAVASELKISVPRADDGIGSVRGAES